MPISRLLQGRWEILSLPRSEILSWSPPGNSLAAGEIHPLPRNAWISFNPKTNTPTHATLTIDD